MTTQQLDRQYVAHTYNRFPLEITGGKGSTVYGADGREYIDLGSGIAVNIFGLGDEQWQSAVTRQLSKVQHTSNLFYCAPVAQLNVKGFFLQLRRGGQRMCGQGRAEVGLHAQGRGA